MLRPNLLSASYGFPQVQTISSPVGGFWESCAAEVGFSSGLVVELSSNGRLAADYQLLYLITF
nr:MAG TPA: hypothetical protein [Caudoviricetes sp.]